MALNEDTDRAIEVPNTPKIPGEDQDWIDHLGNGIIGSKFGRFLWDRSSLMSSLGSRIFKTVIGFSEISALTVFFAVSAQVTHSIVLYVWATVLAIFGIFYVWFSLSQAFVVLFPRPERGNHKKMAVSILSIMVIGMLSGLLLISVIDAVGEIIKVQLND